MAHSNSSVSQFMTPAPHGIEPSQKLSLATKRMDELNCHHLPVRQGGKVIGMLTDKDISFLTGFRGIDLNDFSVRDAMTAQPYLVSPDTPLVEVATTMANERYGAAMVVNKDHELLGIFTYTDALRALSELLASTAKP